MRNLVVTWNQRNVNRVHKWLNITSDFKGNIYRNGELLGYKQAGKYNTTLIFVFNRE